MSEHCGVGRAGRSVCRGQEVPKSSGSGLLSTFRTFRPIRGRDSHLGSYPMSDGRDSQNPVSSALAIASKSVSLPRRKPLFPGRNSCLKGGQAACPKCSVRGRLYRLRVAEFPASGLFAFRGFCGPPEVRDLRPRGPGAARGLPVEPGDLGFDSRSRPFHTAWATRRGRGEVVARTLSRRKPACARSAVHCASVRSAPPLA